MPYATSGWAVWTGDQVAVYVAFRQRLEQLAALPIRCPRDTPDRALETNGWHRTTPWHHADGMPVDHYSADLARWAP